MFPNFRKADMPGRESSFNVYILFLVVAVFSTTVYLVYQQIFSGYVSDVMGHLVYLYLHFYGDRYITHPMWHYGVWWTAKMLHISIEYAAVLFSASLVALWTWLVYRVVQERLGRMPRLLQAFLTLTIIVVGPLCIPWYNRIIELGQGSPNLWHNVTLWTVKPLALLAMLQAVRALDEAGSRRYPAVFALVIISVFAKPSFIVVFLPALFVFALLKKRWRRDFAVFFFLTSAAGAGILFFQFEHLSQFQHSGVVFDFLGVWSQMSGNIAVSIFLGLAFPLVLVLLVPAVLEDDYILLSWLQTFLGIVYFACFAQSGHYYSHGNFGWSYMIAMSLLYLFSIVRFAEIFDKIVLWKRMGLFALLAVQTGVGIYYLVKVLEGQNPIYIAIFF